jgi:hypothetical protein
MPDQQTISEYQNLLHAHRRTLRQLLKQEALSGEAFVPPAVTNGIADARAEIARLKAELRSWGVAVDDEPADVGMEDASPASQPSMQPGSVAVLPLRLWIALGLTLIVLIVGGVALVRRSTIGTQSTTAPTPAPTVVPTAVPTARPTPAPTVAPTAGPAPVFMTRYPLNVASLDLVELVPQAGVSTAQPITDTLRVTQVEFGSFAETNQPAWNIRLAFTNTRDQPVVLDLDQRFFALVDDQGRAAELVYFCCRAKGEVLGAGQAREIQLFFRSPEGWFGKGISAQRITIQVTGLLPIARAAWSFPALATAD